MTFQNTLAALKACTAARAWVGDKTLAEAWDTCDRAEWMLWLCTHASVTAPYGRVALEIARTAQHHDLSGTAQRTLDVLERHLTGTATAEDLTEAQKAAWAAAEAAAQGAEAAASARSAVWAAVAVAEAARAEAAVAVAARADPALTKQHADIVRRYITADAVAEALRKQGY